MSNKLTPAEHLKQIKAYAKERSVYKVYASVLERILRQACAVSAPEALVQSRAKTVSSFAEKCARKFEKYTNPVHEFTDLCGARVIVQTFDQVQAVRQFIDTNFTIIEKEDKGLLLHEHEFGYRDMHYIVQLTPGKKIGITAYEAKNIGKRKAEIQVRTWVQHAWADTLHDRLYKTKLKFSPEIQRTGALLAAIMEDGDRAFSRLALEVDGMLANYSAYAPKDEVEKEIEILNLILANETDKDKKPILALQIARLLSSSGDYDEVLDILKPIALSNKLPGALRCEILLHFGYALCKKNRNGPYGSNSSYARGQQLLKQAAGICQNDELCEVPNLRKRQSLYALANARLGWSYEPIKEKKHRARQYYLAALECEPSNPYYIADVLGYEISYSQNRGLAASVRATITQAISTCTEHALSGTEMPYACFTAGRLTLLLWDGEDRKKAIDYSIAALARYARGIYHCLEGTSVVPADVFKAEIDWLYRVNYGHNIPEWQSWIMELLVIGDKIFESSSKTRIKSSRKQWQSKAVSAPVLIVAGAAESISTDMLKKIRPLINDALEHFRGTVIVGGTAVGVPGCVGEIAKKLAIKDKKNFKLIGYVNEKDNSAIHHQGHYAKIISVSDKFSPAQLMRYWQDIIGTGARGKDILLLGFGGGKLSALEYRMAVAFGASVGVVQRYRGCSGRNIKRSALVKYPKFIPLAFGQGHHSSFRNHSRHSVQAGRNREDGNEFP